MHNDPHPSLICALLQPESYGHAVEYCRLIETHISWVILTGIYVYKIKKPLDLGFLDFSTLEKRRFYCAEELRLNRRLAPGIYLAVVPITGTEQTPEVDGKGEAIEYAVKMLQFEQEAQLDRMLEQDLVESRQIDAFSELIAEFHERLAGAAKADNYGAPSMVWQPMEENFVQIRERIEDMHQLERLAEVERWSCAAFADLEPLLAERKAQGYIRECHGDLHLRNLAWVEGRPLAFDGIEFNPNLRWIDIISEVAFLVMDLQARYRPELAQRFLNSYLERTGDYGGLRLLSFYLVYRAMVRAKVSAIRLTQEQPGGAGRAEGEREFAHYLAIARTYTQPSSTQLLITRGLSGSGKTWLSQQLLEILPAIRIRSDVERKRLYGLAASESSRAAPVEGIYTSEATLRTYGRLLELAAVILDAGYTVIVDATFLHNEQREPFALLAQGKGVSYGILELVASEHVLRRRLLQRHRDASDADLAVLEHQLESYTPLSWVEREHRVEVDTEVPVELSALVRRIRLLPRGR